MVHDITLEKDIKESLHIPSTSNTVEQPLEKMEELFEEVEFDDDVQMDEEDGNEEAPEEPTFDGVHINSTEAASTEMLSEKNNFFSCSKCSYTTHIRGRFTKHIKYHSMPMIKCTLCDFRTPYKWNLDRHMKNHGGNGTFHCYMCNFTADIRQSLTVHEMNHHPPPVGQSSLSRRRNRVGASDVTAGVDMTDTNALISKEEEGSGDSRSSHSASEMGLQYMEKETISCNSDSNDASISDFGRKDNMQITNETDVNFLSEDVKNQKQSRKIPRPIPQLIPLNASTPNQSKTSGEPPCKKLKESAQSPEVINAQKIDNLPIDISLTPVNNSSSKDACVRKKNESFFDRLKERLLTETGEEGSLICKNCGFESKCLSEHSVHEKNCTSLANRQLTNSLHSSLGSTRCQNCRHRCKSSADLYIHMQSCKKKDVIQEITSEVHNQDSSEAVTINCEKEVEPHPMENVVFVWNNISHDTNKFDTPLDISINDDSTLPEQHRNFDSEIVDDNDAETMNLSPSQAVGKRVFKCPYCLFWASTASRFHVHIVGHLNKKPFECSLCKYKSNWRWDITKHIKLKSARDPEHAEAKVIMTDETGRRNYSKYNKFLAMPNLNENGENKFHYIDQSISSDTVLDDEIFNDLNEGVNQPFEMPLNLQTQSLVNKFEYDDRIFDVKKPKRTLWKCKKCNYKDSSKEALLEHVREHSKPDDGEEVRVPNNIHKKPDNMPDPADLAYRCGHCNQLSNWKHVIQRHCRLKHDGVIKVITTVKPKPESSSLSANEINSDTCTKCPFKATDKNMLLAHLLQHQPSPQSIFKCYFCPFFVKDEHELIQHLILHGITDPEDYISKAMGCKSPLPEQTQQNPLNPSSTKRHRCTECPYETNSKSQFMYHEQFHRLPADTPYKCQECNYSVSKRHLLHQHMRVHGIFARKNDMETDFESTTCNSNQIDTRSDFSINLDEIPFVWVSAKNEFHKMYKCRFCSYVNSQKCKIPNHEKIHCVVFENSDITIYKCLECKFTCDNRGRLAEHSKTHGEIYGRIYCPVESDIPDEEQIAKLRKVIDQDKLNATDELLKDEENQSEIKETKTLYFCQKCPARFFADSELKFHDKFHDLTFQNKCKSCEFSVSQENELVAHNSVHTDEYNTKTKMLKFVHKIHALYKDPKLQLVHCPLTSDVTWVVASPGKNYDYCDLIRRSETKHTPKQYYCKECPAKFFKTSALSYHVGLHGSDGDHKCKKCSYAVKNLGNLAKHELLHENEPKVSSCDYESGEDIDYKNIPLSGTDLFQRKTEAQKRVLTDKDKLVKPNDHFPPVLQADPQFGYLMHGNPEFIYPTYLKNGRQKEKRYKCHKCPSAFEKREQYKIHLSLHGSKQRYKCEICDYSVKYYANYVQHMRKHQMNDEAQAERKKGVNGFTENESENTVNKGDDSRDNIKLAIKTMPIRPVRSDFQQFSISDQQTLRLLQRRRSMNKNAKEGNMSELSPAKDRKMHTCIFCPYTNQRQDALNNHYRRHDDSYILTSGNHKCSYCDLVVVQSHFLREHLKTHFSYQKNLSPECFVANENVTFTITKLDVSESTQDFKLDMINLSRLCIENKTYVKIKTGELSVE